MESKMPRYVRLGAAADLIPELASSSALPDQDYPISGVQWPRRENLVRFFRVPPMRPSRAAARRATGEPVWFMSSPAPNTGRIASGALFIDTDGFRLMDGDDF